MSGCDELVTVGVTVGKLLNLSNESINFQPPYCPDVVSAAPGQLLFAPKFDETNFVARSQTDGLDFHVGAAVCVDDGQIIGPPLCVDYGRNAFENRGGRRE